MLVTRTYGVPLDPHVGQSEDPELTVTLAEVGMIFVLFTLLDGVWRGWTVNALLLLGAVLWVLRLVGVLLSDPAPRPP